MFAVEGPVSSERVHPPAAPLHPTHLASLTNPLYCKTNFWYAGWISLQEQVQLDRVAVAQP